MKKIKVAVIGSGHLGRIHARIYSELPEVELVSVCDVNTEKAESAAKLSHCAVCLDYRKLLGTVDAVSIATPTTEHYRIAADFIKSGAHVLVEKPVTTSLQEAERLIRMARRHERILQVGHVERFNPAIRSIRRFCKNPLFIECHRLNPFPSRGTDIGVVLDLMIHDIDIILSLVKSPVKEIQSVGVRVLSDHEDIANARLRFANGTVCNITASRISDDVMRKIRIFQSKSYISLDYAKQKITFYGKKSDGIEKKEIDVTTAEPLAEELISFIKCVQKGTQPLVPGTEAKQALEIALTITRQINSHA